MVTDHKKKRRNTMNLFIKLLLTLALGTTVSMADTMQNKNYILVNKHGVKTTYLLVNNEFALPHTENSLLKPAGLNKLLMQTPSYRLFSLKKGESSIQMANTQSEKKKRSGLVFYKNGEIDDSHRYVSTGMIIVTFNNQHQVEPAAFANKHQLTYIKTIGDPELNMLLFRNASEKNDVELSSMLTKQANINMAKPNWILPLKLF